jgi:hypothetical protein
MATGEKPDAVDRERELRQREQATKEQDPHERNPEAGSGDPLADDERKPAPPGPEAQQPRG